MTLKFLYDDGYYEYYLWQERGYIVNKKIYRGGDVK